MTNMSFQEIVSMKHLVFRILTGTRAVEIAQLLFPSEKGEPVGGVALPSVSQPCLDYHAQDVLLNPSASASLHLHLP